MTLGADLREGRLHLFLTLLRERPTELIRQLSADGGGDVSHSDFTKMFRRFYDGPPSRVRQGLLDDRVMEDALSARASADDALQK